MGPLQDALAVLGTASPAALPLAAVLQPVSVWLAVQGMPAPRWSPDPASLTAVLPGLPMTAAGMATVSAIANLQAQVQAQFGLDLTVAAQAAMFARIAATLCARIRALADAAAGTAASLTIGGGAAWTALAAANATADQISRAIEAGVFVSGAAEAYAVSGQAAAFLASLAPLLPLIAVCVQLNLDMTANFTAELASIVRAVLAMPVPALAAPSLTLMASLAAQLTAVAALSASLGVAVLEVGLAETMTLVSAKFAALVPALEASLGVIVTPACGPALMAALPILPVCASLAAPPAVMEAALSLNAAAVAALTWQPPAMMAIPALQVGLPVVSLAAPLTAVLGISAATAPCAGGCDGNAVLRVAIG